MEIPTNLQSYLKERLKVIATFDAGDQGSQWAIFFGKTKKEGDDFPGKVDDNLGTLTWESERPLWLIPISKSAKEEAEKAITNKIVPTIDYSIIIIRNNGKNKPGGTWDTNYDFWYEDTDKAAWNSDPILTLGINDRQTKLNEIGKWFKLEAKTGNEDEYEEAWPVWVTTEKFKKQDRAIVFPAPSCQIINDKGVYPAFEIWFGVRDQDLVGDKIKTVYRPFITISEEKSSAETDGSDCPVVWREKKRIDDIVQLKQPVADSGSLIEEWKFKNALKIYDEDLNKNPTAQPIVDNFNEAITPFTNQWFILGSDTKKGITKNYFHPVYFRSYSLKLGKELFFKKIYEDTDKTQQVRIAQINCLNELKLLVKLASIGDKELAIWNKKVADIAQGLDQIDASSPVGITPKLTFLSGIECEYIGVWSKSYEAIKSTDITSFDLSETAFIQNNQILQSKSATIKLPRLRPQTYRPTSDPNKATSPQQEITLASATILFQSATPKLNDSGTLFQLILSDYTIQPPEAVVLRDGALAFTLNTSTSKTELISTPTKYGLFRLSLQLVKTQRPFFWWQWYSSLDDFVVESYAVEDFSLPVHRVEAAGQDVTVTDKLVAPRSIGAVNEGFGERKEPSLIIPLNTNEPTESADAAGKQNFLLTLSESVNVGQNYRLDLRLQEFNPGGSPEINKASTHIRAVILDANPQFMGLVDARFLQQPGYDDGAWVVARRSPFSVEAGGWEILDDSAGSEGFYLVLPAQAIGEAYVKNDSPPPNNKPSEPEAPIEYRFGAPSVLRLAPTRLARRYVATPWNLRRIWGSAGDTSPGVPLLEAQFELLYGLVAYLKPKNTFMAELASKLGDVPVPPTSSIAWAATNSQQISFRESWQHYLQFYRAWQSRLAILEPSLTDAFNSAVFDENLTFSPRVKLESSDGLTWERTKGADLKYPIGNEQLGEQAVTNDPLQNKIIAAHNKTGFGLAGGFQEGFESRAIYTEFWREALTNGSSSAELKELAFSSLGGWGKQTARFANDKTIIKANVAMGRTHFYAVERIGRIGVFWHKAKHVIEYERTVVPSLQFSGQPAHLGRPLVRKVREYIEILEPTRNYPDFATDAPDAPGSITSCFFKSIIMPVQSSWGHNVRGRKGELIGWEVPLWKPGADPKVYPKPQVQFTLLPPYGSEERAIFGNLSEPHNLWFYTDTRSEVEAQTPDDKSIVITADVYAWPPVLYVDFTNLPEPEQYDIPPSAGKDSASISAPLPKAIDVFPGFERFTFRVDRHEIPASVAGRYYTNSGISGRLRTVSMMRSSPDKTVAKTWWHDPTDSDQQKSPEKVLASAAKEALALLVADNNSLLAKSANGFDQMPPRGLPEDELKKWVIQHLPANLFDPKLNTLWKLSPNVEKPKGQYFNNDLWPKAEAAGFNYPTRWLWREALQSTEGFINTIHNSYEKQGQLLVKSLNNFLKAADYSIEGVKNYLELFKDRLFDSYFDIDFTVDSSFSFMTETVNASINLLIKNIDELLNELINVLDEVNTNRILKKTEIDAVRNEINYTINTIQACCNRLLNLFDEIKEWNEKVRDIKDKINEILNTCTEELSKLIEQLHDEPQNVNDVINTTKLRLFDYNKNLKQELSLLREEFTFFIDAKRGKLKKILNDLNEIVKNLRSNISDEIEAFKDNIEKDWNVLARNVEVKLNEKLNDEWKVIIQLVKLPLRFILYDGTPSIFSVLQDLDKDIIALEKVVKSSLLNVFGDADHVNENIENWLETLVAYQRLKEAVNTGNEDAILNASIALADSINDEFGRFAGEVAQKVREVETITDVTKDVVQVGKQTLTNFRSVWEEFTTPGMGLNRKTVALIIKTDWKDVEQRLSLTPFISQVKQFDKQLEGLGLHLPVAAITDRLLPAKPDWGEMKKSLLNNFEFSTLFSDIGGIRLDGLFRFPMKNSMRDKIKVTHGFDKQNLMTWVNAEVDLPLDEPQDLMHIGALNLRLDKGRFIGKVRLEGDIDGKVRKTNEGELKGSWAIKINDTILMTFRDARVIFKNDKLSFDMDPERMEMAGLLQMLTQATQTLTSTGAVSNTDSDGNTADVFKVGLIQVGTIPTGIMAQLNTPPISVGSGTTAITNLSFGGFFMLSVLDEYLNFRFKMGIGFYLGKKAAPFTIIIFIFGGGGFIDCALYFEPGLFGKSKGLTVDFSMSILVSAALAINLGWIKGGVAIMLGFELDYHRQPQDNIDPSVSFSFYLYVVGQVNILNVVSVYLSLLLQATYEQGKLTGTGQVVLTIRVCRFFKIKVNKTYTKVFTGNNTSKKVASSSDVRTFAEERSNTPPPLSNEEKAKKILASLA